MQTFLQEIRHAARQLGKAPGFAALAIVTLALGIGANTAMFTVVESLLLRPLPYANPQRLLNISPQGDEVWNAPHGSVTATFVIRHRNCKRLHCSLRMLA